MLSLIYTYSFWPSCIMVSMVLLRCCQYRCYDHIWAAICKSFNDTFALKVTLIIYLFFNLCRLNNTFTFKVILSIYLFYNFCRCYQYDKYYYHAWAINYNVIHLCLEGDPYYIFILQSM